MVGKQATISARGEGLKSEPFFLVRWSCMSPDTFPGLLDFFFYILSFFLLFYGIGRRPYLGRL